MPAQTPSSSGSGDEMGAVTAAYLRRHFRDLAKNRAITPLATAWHMSKMSLTLFRARVGHLITRLQQRRWKSGETVWTHTDGRSFIATPLTSFRSTEVATVCLDALLETLQAAGVTHEVIMSPPEPSHVVVKDLPQALAAIGHSPESWYVDTAGRTRAARKDPLPIGNDPATVFRAWATHDGHFLAGSDVGVQLITESPTTARTTPVFPIDAVFTWVDGADPLWQQRKQARESDSTEGLHTTAANTARYASNDELRYALRSVEMYAPWLRHIFLVTDQQVPSWLDVEHPRVRVVDHREIFDDPQALPTFNSHAIESRLHHIPGLAEHYIYFNDDVFLARALPPSFFFEPDGRLHVFLAPDEIDTGPVTRSDPPVVTAAKNNRDLLRELTGYELRHKLKHVPHPQLKSLALELEGHAYESFRTTAGSPFRSPDDLSTAASLIPHYALATSRGTCDSIRHIYVDVASPELRWRLPVLQEKRGVDVVCLNATLGSSQVRKARQFLEDLFPTRTTLEDNLATL